MNSILPSFGKDVSIDIGTSMTRVMGGYAMEQGMHILPKLPLLQV